MEEEVVKKKVNSLEVLYKSTYDYLNVEENARTLLECFDLNDSSIYKCITLNIISQVQLQLGKYHDALSNAELALELTNQMEDKSVMLKVYGTIGTAHSRLQNFQSALFYLRNAVTLSEELGNISALAQNLGNMGDIYSHLSDYTSAIKYYKKTKEIYESKCSKGGVASTLVSTGIIYCNMSNFVMAVECASKALYLYNELNDKRGMAICNGNIGVVYWYLADFEMALKFYKQSLKLHEQIGNQHGVQSMMGNIGIIYSSLADYKQALEYYNKALSLSKEIGNKVGEAIIYGNIGNLYSEQHDFERAIEYNLKSLSLYNELGNKHHESIKNGNIGELLRKMCQYNSALEYLNKALIVDEQLGNKTGIARHFGIMATIYSTRTWDGYSFDKAKKYFTQALCISDEVGLKKEKYSFHKRYSETLEKEGFFSEALLHYKQYYELEKEVLSEEAKKSAERFHFERTLLEKENEQKLERQRHEAEKEKVWLELQHKEKELETSINQIVEKNNFLQEISSDIQQFVKKHKTSNPEGLEHIVEQIRKHMSHGAVSGMIYDEITSVHGEFMKRIKKQHPGLTDMEIRVSALLRMKLTSANIASLLFISQRTVETHRLRIRKKLGINKDDNLYMILQEI